MAKVNVYNLKRESVGELELDDSIFGAEVNEGLIYDVLKAQLASKRGGNAKAKGRSEVAATSQKMYRQKGTGNARHGSRGAMLMVGGGKAHGPLPRDYGYRPPRKMRQGAMRSALSLKLKEGKLTVVDSFELPEIKTKALAGVLSALQVDGALIVDAKDNDKLRLSARNMGDNQFLPPEGVNLYDVLRHPNLILTKDAALALQTRLQKA